MLITSSNVDETDLGFLLAAAVAMITVISKALVGLDKNFCQFFCFI